MSEAKYVVFRLGDERYGLPIGNVERILPSQDVTRLPKTPKMMLGVFDMRGTTIPVIDARQRFGLAETDDCRSFVVVLSECGRCALRVDSVEGIHTYEEDQIDTKHTMIDAEDDFVHAIGKHGEKLTVLLDAEGIVPKALRKRVAATAQAIAA